MKNAVLLTVLVVLGLKTWSVNDTLRLYDPKNVLSNYYNTGSFPVQIARFDLPYPAIIKGFILNVKGEPGSSFKMQFAGHEGGVALISLMNNLIPPKTITKQNSGQEKIYVPLDSPFVKLDNTQFSLVFSEFNNLNLITDRTDHPFSCKSSSGGDYYYQYGINSQGQFALLTAQNRAFAIDVIVEYPQTVSQQVFVDVTEKAGISTNLSNSSIASADYNNDGFLDLLISGRFYENNKDGTFKDITTDKNLINKYSSVAANAFLDMDNDGDLDIILFGGDTSVLFINENGIFTEKILNLPDFKAFLSFSFTDINNDKYPDLFVGQLWQTYPQPEPNYFFLNNGNNDFIDSTRLIYPLYDGIWNWPNRAWDPANYIVERNRNSRGSQWIDYDNDGDPDLFVTNYFLQADEFYKNNGDNTFTDICKLKGIDVNNTGSNHGTGVDWYDYDNDGDLDLLLPQFAHPRFIGQYDHRGTAIYRNDGAPSWNFTDIIGQYNNYTGLKSPVGLELEETHAGGAWGDVNNDGLADILLTVFYGCRYISLYEQQPDHQFIMKTFDYGLWKINTGTDLVWFDFENNGRLDLACGTNNKFSLFANNKYNDRKWLEIDLRSVSANTFAIGGRVYVYAGGKQYMQEVSAGRGQKMQKPYRLHFGLDYASSIDSVIVLWPAKPQKREKFSGLEPDNSYILKEGGSITLSSRQSEFENKIKVYPNPVSDYLTIESRENSKITVFNSFMQKTDEFITTAGTNYLDIRNYPDGFYIGVVENEFGKSTFKIIVRH